MESRFSAALSTPQTQIQFSPFRTGRERRTPRKSPYTPYRGDCPELGRKTGIVIWPVERDEDGFESFEEVLKQADYRDAWTQGIRRTSSPVTSGSSESDYVMVEDVEKNDECMEEDSASAFETQEEDVFSAATPATPSQKFRLMSWALVAASPPSVPQSVEDTMTSAVEVAATE